MSSPNLEKARESLTKASERLQEFHDPYTNSDGGTPESLARVASHLLDALHSLIDHADQQQ